MGYQESYVQFENEDILFEELKKYKKRDTDGDLAYIIGLVIVTQKIGPFHEGEYLMVVSGERSEQRNSARLYEGLGIGRVHHCYFIDDFLYDHQIELDDYFKTVMT